jgi:hypothetical protein
LTVGLTFRRVYYRRSNSSASRSYSSAVASSFSTPRPSR